MSDAKARQRWEARRKMIADEFFAGDEAVADAVFDELPYSAIPEWGDVAAVARVLDDAGLLATPAHDSEEAAAKALREAANEVTYAVDWWDAPESVESWLHERADRIERMEKADE